MEEKIRALLQEAGVPFKTDARSFICTWKSGRFVCWYCRETEGFEGRVEVALTELCSIPIVDLKKTLYGDLPANAPAYISLGMDLQDEGEADYLEEEGSLLKPMAWPLEFHPIESPMSKKGAQYLEGRGIPVAIAAQYGIRYWPAKSSVIFPVESQGNLYGWQRRLIEGDQPYWNGHKLITPLKALTSEGLRRDRVLMFSDRIKDSNHIVITEGPVDAIKAHLCGGNVATLGKAVSDTQLELIANSGVEKVYLGLDPDAYLELDRIRKKLGHLKIYDLRPPAPYKDLGEMSFEEVKSLFDSAPILLPAAVTIYLKNFSGAK
jgi:hypothetical protein